MSGLVPPAASISSSWSLIDSRIQVFEASRPAAMTSSVTLGAPASYARPGRLGAAGLDHHDGHVVVVEQAPGHDQLEGRRVALFVGGERDPLAVGAVGDPHGADGALERDARQAQGGRGAVDGHHVVGVDQVGAEDGADDVDLVAEAVGEARAQRAVDQATGEDGLVAGLALTTEERAGDLAGGVHALFDVDGEGEEVGALAGGLGRRWP